MTIIDLISTLTTALVDLSQTMVEEQMRDFLLPEELPGLEKKIRIGVNKLLEMLRSDGLSA